MIAQLKKDFLSSSPPKPVEPQEKTTPEKKTNKYLKTENRWSGPAVPQPQGTNGIVEDTVQAFQAPQIHHAEVVNLRQDTSSESEEESITASIRQAPLSMSTPQPLSLFEQQQMFLREQEELQRKFQEEREQLQREHDALMQKQQELLLKKQPTKHKPQVYPQQYQPQYQQQPQQQQYQSPQQQYQPQQQQYQPQQQQYQHPVQQKPGLNRSFEDPALTTYQEDQSSPSSNADQQDLGSPGKKKGFFSSFFKKPSPSSSSGKKGRSSRGKRPRSEYVPDEDNQMEDEQAYPENDMSKSHTDGDLHLHTLERSPVRLTPVVPQPGASPRSGGLNKSVMASMHKNESMITHPGMSFEQELGYDYDDQLGESFSDEPVPHQPLQRKLSMSKPTDLDEMARLQEQVNQILFSLKLLPNEFVF